MKKHRLLRLSQRTRMIQMVILSLAVLGAVYVLLARLAPGGGTKVSVDEAYGKLPLSFELNTGQTDAQVKFLWRGAGYSMFFTSTEAVLVLTRPETRVVPGKSRFAKAELSAPEKTAPTVIRTRFAGANAQAQVVGVKELPGKVNYFFGNDPAKWRTQIPTYSNIEYRDLYPGVNLVFYGNPGQLEYDFVVAAGADPRAIRMGFEGVDHLTLDAQGNLILHTASERVVQRAPVVYQEIDGKRQYFAGRYVIEGQNQIGFQVAAYDASRPLVIDPVLVYSTYLGGSSGDGSFGVAVDTSGSAYLLGTTGSPNFPTANPFQPASGGSFDVFVAKVNPAGSALVYSTYLGGSSEENGIAIAVDAMGNAYVTGLTTSSNFPTANAFQAAFGGAAGFSLGDAFVTKLDSSGVVVYSTYLGGSADDAGTGITVDATGNVYVIGNSDSPNFPTANAFQPTLAGGFDAFVTKLDATGSTLVYSTYLGGSGVEFTAGIAVDGSGNAYLTGSTGSTNFPTVNPLQPALAGVGNFLIGDAFVAKLNATGSALTYSTYLGGGRGDFGAAVAVDAAGNAYVVGFTDSPDFPTFSALQSALGGGFDAFVAKLNANASALVYSTYLGGSGDDFGIFIALDSLANAYVTGQTVSANFPTANALQSTFGGGGFFGDAFVAKLNSAGSTLVYSTYLGGSGDDRGLGIVVDAAGNAYVSGGTDSPNFPTVSPLQPALGGSADDAFVAKISEINTPVGTNVVVQPADLATGTTPVTLTFSAVTQAGVTSLTTGSTGPTPPSGFLLGSPPTHYDLATTAAFSGSVEVCINYSAVSFTDESQLKLFHFEGGTWVDRTISLDTTNNVICASVTSLSPFAIFEPGLAVTIDIKPGSFPNTINLGSGGSVPVAIFSTPTFDARTVDPLSVTLASAPARFKGKGTPMTSVQDVSGDGLLDLIVHVDTTALQLTQTDTVAVLKGSTSGGTAIGGNDSVRVVP